MTSENRDYYQILGVSHDASSEEIRAAYRERAREYHPDRNPSPDAVERMQEINEAWEVLRDASLRPAYDRWRNARQSTARDADTSTSHAEVHSNERNATSIFSMLLPCLWIFVGVWAALNTDFPDPPFMGEVDDANYYFAAFVIGVAGLTFLKRWWNAQRLTRAAGMVGGLTAVGFAFFPVLRTGGN